jgi:predicted CXXCH cytochrome family protein
MHQVGVAAATEFPPGTPVSREGTTTCFTCHYYHAADQPKLWRGTKEQCGAGCHNVESPDGAGGGPGTEEEAR